MLVKNATLGGDRINSSVRHAEHISWINIWQPCELRVLIFKKLSWRCVCVSFQACTFPAAMRTATTGKCSVTRAKGSAGVSIITERWWALGSTATPSVVGGWHLGNKQLLCAIFKIQSNKTARVLSCLFLLVYIWKMLRKDKTIYQPQ